MMYSDDDDEEPRLNAVENYYFVLGDDEPVSFSVLPFQFDAGDEVQECKKGVSLQGTTDGGLQKVFKEVVAWKLGLGGKRPEIAVRSTDGSWIDLLKPRAIYEETIRTILITVEMLHFLRRRPAESEKNLWDHLRGVFRKFEVRPSEDDFRNHRSLIKLFAERDPILAKSEILQTFIEEGCRKKINEDSSSNLEIKQSFIADDEEIEEMAAEDNMPESDDDEEEEDLFDSVCAICDNGGDLLCCEGPCMRSFHAREGDGEDSYCDTLGYTVAEVDAIKNFLCKNCEYKQHQCFVCGVLEPSDGPNAKVFLCNNATCGHFYHPKCVARLLHPNNRNEASELEEKIAAGLSFTCPVHWCFRCKGLEDRTQKPLQFAVCRRCPRSYHRECLPREISFDDIEEEDIITRAWELSKRILIYCLDHGIDMEIGTPIRDHIKFPHIPKIEKPKDFVKKKVKALAKKRRALDDSDVDEPSKKPMKLSEKFITKESELPRKVVRNNSSELLILKPEKKKVKHLKEKAPTEPALVEGAPTASSPKPAKEEEKQLGALPSVATGRIPQSSFPVVDSETEKRVMAFVKKEVSSLTLEDVSRKCIIPSTHACYGRHIDKIIARGKLERSVQAVQAALQKLENGGTVDDAKAVCEPEVLRQLARWNSKLKVYLAPFIHGMRYTSFGRHFTKVEKLGEIVNKLHWYVQPDDTIVDFCCGANDFSRLMKEKLDSVGKTCNFKNYDVIQPKNCFCFEKRDWMTVKPKELPHGSKLIMGLNPPFGVKAALANKFIDKALTFKPKLIILIVPKETERLDQKKLPYDLVWEDDQSLSGKSFYLPGSVDVYDKQIDQWNASPPLLYLWSRHDWTEKHKKVAERHDHTSIGTVASHARREEANLLDDLPVQKQAEAAYEQNFTSGKSKETCRDESKSSNTRRARTPEQLDVFPPEKQVEVAYEEKKTVLNRKDARPEERRDAHHEVRDACPEERRDAHHEVRDARPEDGRNACLEDLHDDNQKTEVSNRKFRNRREPKKTAEIADDVKADSDMSISSPDTRNAQNESWGYSPIPSECPPSDRMARQGSYSRNPAPEPHRSPPDRAPSQDNIFRTNDECRTASVGQFDPAFSTHSVGDSSRRYSPDLQELTRRYGAAPTGDAYGRYYRRQSSEDRFMDYTMDRSSGAAPRNSVADADLRERVRMYGGLSRDDPPQMSWTPPATDVQGNERLYAGQRDYDYPQTSRYSFESSDARFGQHSLYGSASLSAAGSSATDRYAPRLDETNYRTGGPRDPYDVPSYRRDMPPDPMNLAPEHRYPYPRPGSSGGWFNR